jgi:hypothetical protein
MHSPSSPFILHALPHIIFRDFIVLIIPPHGLTCYPSHPSHFIVALNNFRQGPAREHCFRVTSLFRVIKLLPAIGVFAEPFPNKGYVGVKVLANDVFPATHDLSTCTFWTEYRNVRWPLFAVKALRYKPEGRGFKTRLGERFLSIFLILPAALGPGVHSASNKNEYQRENVSGDYIAAGAWGWQPHRHLSGDSLDNVGSLTSHNLTGLHGRLRG